MKRNRRSTHLATALLLSPVLGLSACSDDGAAPLNPPEAQLEVGQIGLRAFDSCGELEGYFKAQAHDIVEAEGYHYYGGGGMAWDDAVPEANVGADGGGGEGGSSAGESAPPSRSGTNNQEAGVDEPDIIKDDGRFIYAVAGDQVKIYSAADLRPLSTITPSREGRDLRLVLDGDRLGILSTVHDLGSDESDSVRQRGSYSNHVQVEIFSLDAQRTSPQPLKRSLVEGRLVAARLIGGTVRAVINHDALPGIQSRGYERASEYGPQEGGMGGYPGGEDPSWGGAGGADWSEGGWEGEGGGSGGMDEPGFGGEDGGASEAEPSGDPPPPLPEPFARAQSRLEGDWSDIEDPYRRAIHEVIEESQLDDWMPRRYDVADGVLVPSAVTDCASFHRPGEAAGAGVTAIVSFNLHDTAQAFEDPAVVTNAGVVYVSPSSLYLTTTNQARWGWAMTGGMGGPDVAVAVDFIAEAAPVGLQAQGVGQQIYALDTLEDPEVIEEEPEGPQREATQIHRLDFAGAASSPRYVGSGRVFGTPLNQFSLGDYQDHVRIATTERRVTDWETTNHLFVLGQGGKNGLEIVGQITDLAETERIYAVRFMGPIGFMVTFKQVDPLFTFDLADPRAPQMLGELKIPGFSTYLHPLGEDHLIGIGQSATEEGRITGMQLSMFDVSDLSDPRQTHVHALGEGYSDALYEHLAFTYYSARNMLAIPISSYDWGERGEYRSRVGVELFKVSTETGFEESGFIGTVDEDNYGWYDSVRRTLFIGDTFYMLTNQSLSAWDLGSLSLIDQVNFGR